MHRLAMRSFEFVLLAGLLSVRGTTPEPPPPPHSLPFFPSTPPFSSPLPPSTSRTVSLTLSTREHMSTSGHLDTNMTAPAHLPSTATASPVFTSFADNSTGAPPNLSSALAPNFTSTRSLYYSGSLATRNTSLSNLSNSTRTGIEIVSENKTVVNTAESSPLSMSSQMPTSVAVTQVTVTGGEASSTTHQASSLAVLISLRTASTTSKHSSLTTVLQKRAPGNKQPQPEALSSGSVAAIVTGFIVIVILLFGGAYYFKMRRSTYGRLLDDCDYGSMGNFRNPMFEQ